MICDNNDGDDDANYRGLDSSRDTEAQVETALRFFPEVISQPCWEDGDEDEGEDEDEDEEYPIQRLCNNRKALSFIAGVARLAIEYHSFEDHERGGFYCWKIFTMTIRFEISCTILLYHVFPITK